MAAPWQSFSQSSIPENVSDCSAQHFEQWDTHSTSTVGYLFAMTTRLRSLFTEQPIEFIFVRRKKPEIAMTDRNCVVAIYDTHEQAEQAVKSL